MKYFITNLIEGRHIRKQRALFNNFVSRHEDLVLKEECLVCNGTGVDESHCTECGTVGRVSTKRRQELMSV
jgi:DnaJ-class molecular chaperone